MLVRANIKMISGTVLLASGYIGGVVTGRLNTLPELLTRARKAPQATFLLGGSLFLAVLVILGSFPDIWVTKDGVVNIFAHAAGIVIGMALISAPSPLAVYERLRG